MNIIKCTSTHNTTAKPNRKIEWIVLHYTAGTTSKSGKALDVAKMFSRQTREASADFIVDDGSIVQYNRDIANRYCWAVGGSKYANKTTSEASKYYGKCKNNNSISIEMCSTKKNTKSLLATDDDWSITAKTVNNAVDLVKCLMVQYKIDASHVIMHHHVTGKPCPQPWCKNEAALKAWKSFKKKLTTTASTPKPTTASTTSYYPKYAGKTRSIVDALQTLKIDSGFSSRKKIAKANGISDYSGTASQNTKLLTLLKQGKLKKA